MTNRARFTFGRNTNVKIKGRQRESASVSRQSFKLQSSDFDEVRVKLRQIGRGKQTLQTSLPLLSNNTLVVKKTRRPKNGRTI